MTDQITPQIDADGADPWVVRQDNAYYYTKTTGGNVTIFRSKMLTDLAAGESRVIYEADDKLENFWAPEIHRLDGAWYVYFAANTYESDVHRMYALINQNEDPMEGEWQCMEMQGMDDKFAIDGTVLDLNDKRYFIWSGWEGYENVQQNLYLARMTSPTQVEREKILLSEPGYDWERQGDPLVNEGPQMFVKNGTVNLLYSASGSWTNDYCMGLLSAPADADITDPAVWTKEKEPVFRSANGIYGPGHGCFVKSPDNGEDYLIFHSARWDGGGWSRSVRLQRVDFDENGKIRPAEPLGSDTLMTVPSGEPQRLRFTADDFDCTEGIRVLEEDSSFKTAASGFEDTGDSLTLRAKLPEAGEYTVFVFARIEDILEEGYRSGLDITVNGEKTTAQLASSGYYQPLCVRRMMKKGENTVEIRSEAGGDRLSIQRIEFMPAS